MKVEILKIELQARGENDTFVSDTSIPERLRKLAVEIERNGARITKHTIALGVSIQFVTRKV